MKLKVLLSLRILKRVNFPLVFAYRRGTSITNIDVAKVLQNSVTHVRMIQRPNWERPGRPQRHKYRRLGSGWRAWFRLHKHWLRLSCSEFHKNGLGSNRL